MKRILLFLIIFTGMAVTVCAQNSVQEIVYLKNGSIIRGVIIEQIPNRSLKIRTADGNIFICQTKDVNRITKEANRGRKQLEQYYHYTSYHTAAGYRGFIDLGYTIGIGDRGLGRAEFNTSHGCQVNPYFFFGLGAGLHYYHKKETAFVPIYTDFRGNFLNGSVVPFVGFKAGYSFDASHSLEDCGPYLAPSVGVKFDISDYAAMNISIGYTAQWIRFYDCDSPMFVRKNNEGFSVKAGFEF
jgi:hypothetical protein